MIICFFVCCIAWVYTRFKHSLKHIVCVHKLATDFEIELIHTKPGFFVNVFHRERLPSLFNKLYLKSCHGLS